MVSGMHGHGYEGKRIGVVGRRYSPEFYFDWNFYWNLAINRCSKIHYRRIVGQLSQAIRIAKQQHDNMIKAKTNRA